MLCFAWWCSGLQADSDLKTWMTSDFLTLNSDLKFSSSTESADKVFLDGTVLVSGCTRIFLHICSTSKLRTRVSQSDAEYLRACSLQTGSLRTPLQLIQKAAARVLNLIYMHKLTNHSENRVKHI